MKKLVAFMLIACLIVTMSVSSALAATSSYSVSWRCTRPVSVTNLDTGKVATEYIHAATVTFKYNITSTSTAFTGGSYVSKTSALGIAGASPLSVSDHRSSFSVSSDKKQIKATFSGFNVALRYKARASKTNSAATPNSYHYSEETKNYTFTSQSVSRTHNQ